MKRFEFSLEQVLWLKQQQERLAALRQEQTRMVLDQATAEIARLQAESERIASLAPTFLALADPLAFRTVQARHLEQLQRLLDQALERARVVQQEWDAARAKRVAIAKDFEVLQTLRAQQRDLYRREREHHDQQRIEELVMQRWNAVENASEHQQADAAREDVP